MKTKLFCSLLLLAAALAPGALAAADGGDRNFHTGRGQFLVTPVDDQVVKDVPTSPAVVPNDPKQVLQDYDSLMMLSHRGSLPHSRRLQKPPSVAT
jgi:hypothetical protein